MLFVWLRRRQAIGWQDAAVDVSTRYPLVTTPTPKCSALKSFSLVLEREREWRTSTTVTHGFYVRERESVLWETFSIVQRAAYFRSLLWFTLRFESEYRRSIVCLIRQRPAVLFYLQRRRGFAATWKRTWTLVERFKAGGSMTSDRSCARNKPGRSIVSAHWRSVRFQDTNLGRLRSDLSDPTWSLDLYLISDGRAVVEAI